MKVLEEKKGKSNGKSVVLLSSVNSTKYGLNPARGEYRSHVEFLKEEEKPSSKQSKR
jgi:hypothetical protein